MNKLIGQVQESTLLKVKETFERIKKAFMAADSGVFLPTVVLVGDPTKNHTGVILLRGLVGDKMLEAQIQKRETGGRPLEYRPTQGGWLLLERIEQFSAKELHDRYMDRSLAKRGALPYQGDKQRAAISAARSKAKPNGSCSTCGSKVADRRSNATLCWACEEPARRAKAGRDNVTRSVAYLQLIGPKRAAEEQERVGRVAGGKRGSEVVVRDHQVEHPPLYSVKVTAQLEAILTRLSLVEARLTTLSHLLQRSSPKVAKPNGQHVAPRRAERILASLERALREDA